MYGHSGVAPHPALPVALLVVIELELTMSFVGCLLQRLCLRHVDET
ncbi:hypothetical protein [Streptomyces afghaniensis]|nr:hypothetical protein [Streptomyces afghaniensis]MDQ1013521.1 hypothetical protein [Streptomyces afghaniensis]